MGHKSSSSFQPSAALRAVAQSAISENIEGAQSWAEGVTQFDPELRYEMIATAAYFIAEQRGFAPGHEQEDWYRAEAAIDNELPRLLARS